MDDEPLRLGEADPTWAEQFDALAAKLRSVLAGLPVDIEYVGSTSVPGIAATPIIDVDVVMPSVDLLVAVAVRLKQAGYQPKGMRGVAGREAFDGPPGHPTHYLYVVVSGSKARLDHMLFRDLLGRRSDPAGRYEAVKRVNTDRLRQTERATPMPRPTSSPSCSPSPAETRAYRSILTPSSSTASSTDDGHRLLTVTS